MFLMGNFQSRIFGRQVQSESKSQALLFQTRMSELADLIASYENLLNQCHFVFIPGPLDVGSNNILPRHPLPKMLTKSLVKKLPKVTCSTSPCRVRFFNQQITVFREDLVNTMRRHCVVPPSADDANISNHLVRTLIDQSHLCPLPLTVRPIYWNYDHCLHLYPLPDVLILADRFTQYQTRYKDCLCFNPGTFSTDFSFISYNAAERKPDLLRIPNP